MGRVTERARVLRIDTAQGRREERADVLAAEDPLEIRIGTEVFTVTMRTPGHDVELVLGLLHAEGVLRHLHDVVRVAHGHLDEVTVTLADHVPDPSSRARSLVTSSACGVCGSASADDLRIRPASELGAGPVLDVDVLLALPDRLRSEQTTFSRTGGVHAAGLFTNSGEPVVVREDVGRHNAVDKVVGWAMQREMLPLRDHVLQVSGRASFELVQKARLAGVPVLSAVSAPSSMAVQVAREEGMTLAGFVRGTSLNVYTGSERLAP